MVKCEPELRVMKRKLGKDGFLVIACDGIWDCVTNEQCANIFRGMIKKTKNKTKKEICSKNLGGYISRLFDQILPSKQTQESKGKSFDNITCIVIKFQQNSKETKSQAEAHELKIQPEV